MFVCVVSRRTNRTLLGDMLESAAAADNVNWFFPQLGVITEATAAATDQVDAFKGQYLTEAASASDTTNATLLTGFSRAMFEPALALDTGGGIVPRTVTGAMAEAASAADTLDATAVAPAPVAADVTAGTGAGHSAIVSMTSGTTQIIAGVGVVKGH